MLERILDATAGITIGGGWASVSMGKVASAVGVSRQTVHTEVGTKAELAEALVIREVEGFLAEVVGDPAVLVGNSMGGLIATMVASREGAPVLGLVLIDPALPAPRGRPDAQAVSLFTLLGAPIQRAIRARRGRPRSIAAEVTAVLRLCIAQWDRLDEDVFEAHVDLAKAQSGYEEVNASFKLAGRTMIAALARRSVVRRRLAGIRVPVLLIQGDRDRLVHVSAARWAAQMNPDWEYVEMAGVGHVPMLEMPDDTAQAVTDWLSRTNLGKG